MLKKKIIKKSIFEYVASMLIVKKFKKKFKICVNYKVLNVLIIKNCNAFSLIKKISTKLSLVKIYNKFDIIVVFNKVKMKENNEHKTAFFTWYKLFKYVIMLFKLYNALNIFQIFINATLKEYLNDFCISYLNNILIYNNNKKQHIEHVFKILKQLKHVNLFLNINKCEFFVIFVKYLKFIITTKEIKINFVKVEIIVNWKFFKNLKNVQTFIKFVNFYKKFVFDYSKIAFFLIRLIKLIKKNFVFS